MTPIVDAHVRQAAIDPLASFCVSAPAGSGKTELLIQRYLGLLSRVERPEQVLAITFTRKAAAEMRERVLAALQQAHLDAPGTGAHQQVTRRLAQQVIAADVAGEWHLLRDSYRLNIKTIDSFCAGLTRQMPILSQFGGQAAVENDVSHLYAEAVMAMFKLLETKHPAATDLAAIALHFDNDWQRITRLLVTMLGRRDQWGSYIGIQFSPQSSETYLVTAVDDLVSRTLTTLAQTLAPYQSQLLELLRYASVNLDRPVPAQFPDSGAASLAIWRDLRGLLLTGNGHWRKMVTVNDGFPAGKGERQARKSQLLDILAELQQIEGLKSALHSVAQLPEIASGSRSWQLAIHVSRILPTLAAQLLLVFEKHGVVDHVQVAQSALMALGDDDNPTELALRLDYQLEHILVDEFQDTAITQYELIHKLTRGWGEHNALHPEMPRTLMIVGDAMQSIYGFRGANVGLFLKAQQQGFNGVTLQPLELRCNFRSQQGVVDWINQTFENTFPTENDVYRSEVRYSPATAIRPCEPHKAVEIHGFEGANATALETDFICDQIREFVSAGVGTLAVLGRNRKHLQDIVRRLTQLGVPFTAPELNSLADSPVVADLLSLCRVLNNSADRLAWMSILRAPWCGLLLSDLLAIAQAGGADPDWPVRACLSSPALAATMSDDGRQRLYRLLPILDRAEAKRDRLGLRVWIEQAWLSLGGPECVGTRHALDDAEHFFQLLELADAQGIGLDLQWLDLQLKQRAMQSGDAQNAVSLLTLHKSKGLEFDHVIIPALSRTGRSDARDILLWDEYSDSAGDSAFLLASDDHSTADEPTLYNFLLASRKRKAQLESARLMYVGATRAIRKLVLTCQLQRDRKTQTWRAPARGSLLQTIWHAIEQQVIVHQDSSTDPRQIREVEPPLLTRLKTEALPRSQSAMIDSQPSSPAGLPRFADSRMQRSVGTVVHQALEALSLLPALPNTISGGDRLRWRMALQREGLWGAAVEQALEQVQTAISATLQAQGSGRWVLSSAHQETHSEWPLTTVDAQGRVRDIVVDRCFIDVATGVRWIIDYKTSSPENPEDIDAFIARESANYRDQLMRYRDAIQAISNETIRCALYFPLLGYLHTLTELELPDPGAGPVPGA